MIILYLSVTPELIASMAFAISLMTKLAAGRHADLERRLPHRVVSDLIAHAEDAVGAKALNPGNCDLAMKQAMVNAK